MALPKLNDTPSYSMIVPSTGKEVLYRPYLVKEEKILLMAFEANDEKQAMRAMVDVIDSCVKNGVDAKSLTTFDVEHMFTQIRAKSVGEKANIGIKCSSCEASNEIEIDLGTLNVTKNELGNVIELTDDISVEMRYPSFLEMSDAVGVDLKESEFAYDTITKCIGAIVTEDERYDADDVSKKELTEFVEGLTSAQFIKLGEWLQEMPKLSHTVTFKCNKCEADNEHILEGMQSFF